MPSVAIQFVHALDKSRLSCYPLLHSETDSSEYSGVVGLANYSRPAAVEGSSLDTGGGIVAKMRSLEVRQQRPVEVYMCPGVFLQELMIFSRLED